MKLTPIAFNLSDEDKKKLTQIANHPGSSQRSAFRCRCVLLCAEGIEVAEVARRLGVTRIPVRKWRDRFLEKGFAGLKDAPRPGQPRKITREKTDEIVRLTQTEKPPKGRTQWSCATMAARAGVTPITVSRIWRAYGLKPHLTKTL